MQWDGGRVGAMVFLCFLGLSQEWQGFIWHLHVT